MNVEQFHLLPRGWVSQDICQSTHVSINTCVDQECVQQMRIQSLERVHSISKRTRRRHQRDLIPAADLEHVFEQELSYTLRPAVRQASVR